MGCGDHWPRCDGEWFPPLDLPTLIEIGHRWAAALVSLFVFAVAVVAWRRHRSRARAARTRPPSPRSCWSCRCFWARSPSSWSSRPGSSSSTAPTRWCCWPRSWWWRSGGRDPDGRGRSARRSSGTGDHRLVLATAALGFVVILFGAQVANFDAGLLCLGFPLCNGRRLAARRRPWPRCTGATGSSPSRSWSCSGCWWPAAPVARPGDGRRCGAGRRSCWRATVAQIGVAAAMMLQPAPAGLRALHLLVGTAGLGHAGRSGVPLRRGRRWRPSADAGRIRARSLRPASLADLVTLTKPRIISLLLVTTIAPMFITDRPGCRRRRWSLWVLLGGLPDGRRRQRDQHVVRPGHRHPDDAGRGCGRSPPAGSRPASGCAFGVALGALAFAIFWYQVNPLSAWLALGGLLFYVFVYTIWLKRSSPQNIVIGGAAGAFPPLVGWAAMTGRARPRRHLPLRHHLLLDPAALLGARADQAGRLRQGRHPDDAGGAGRGADQVRDAGVHPDAAAADDPAGGLRRARAVLRRGGRAARRAAPLVLPRGCCGSRSVTPVAWKMYRYSLLYLALLFVAMGVDRALPFGHRHAAPAKVIILDARAPARSHGHSRPSGHRRPLSSAPRVVVTDCASRKPPRRRLPPPGRLVRLWPRVRPYRGTSLLASAGAGRQRRCWRSPSRWWSATCSTPRS